jgi:hypothetical protein
LTHTWTSDERVVCGTEDGKLYVFESNGELKFEIVHGHGPTLLPRSVNVMVSYSKGILVGSNGGSVTLYERGDDVPVLGSTATGGVPIVVATTTGSTNRDALRKTREFSLVEDGSGIIKLAVSPTDEFFVCITEKSQLYGASLTSSEVKVPFFSLFKM